jgi:signal transduction histidine kinase
MAKSSTAKRSGDILLKSKSLQQYVNRSWLLSGTVALMASLILFLAFGYYNFFRDLKYAHEDLDAKAQIIARRVSSELLIAPHGAPKAVALNLANELKISNVIYGTTEELAAVPRSEGLIYSEIAVPFLEDKYHLRAADIRPDKLQYFNFAILVSCILLTVLTIGTGIFLQTRYLNRHLIKPIKSLVGTSTGEAATSADWPIELHEISRQLTASFEKREHEVYSQMARGVIHDIKTILQSMKVATDLAIESPSEARLKNLMKVSQTKLPSLLQLLETTLDGSREISLSRQSTSLVEAINKSIETVSTLAFGSNPKIEFAIADYDMNVSHDPVQLERVITNLLKNGLESADEVAGTSGRVRISFNMADKDFIGVVVEDSGGGLPANPESVFRVLKSTKPHGSGLGLLVSKKIVEAHNGKLIAGQSIELNGAKFEILLPRGDLV